MADTFRNHKSRCLWVPAFAGTTMACSCTMHSCGFNFQTAAVTCKRSFAISPRLRASFAGNVLPSEFRGRGECRVPAAPAASCAKCWWHTSVVATGPPVHPAFPHAMVLTVSFVLLCPKNLPECANGRFSTNRPSLDLSPFVLKGCEPDGEPGTDPVSSSTRTVAWASSPDRARKGVDDGTKRSRCRRH